MAALRHPNVVMFMGLCLEPPCIVTEFCARGSLYDVLKKARASPAFAQQLDWSKRLSMALDAAKVLLACLWICLMSSVYAFAPCLSPMPSNHTLCIVMLRLSSTNYAHKGTLLPFKTFTLGLSEISALTALPALFKSSLLMQQAIVLLSTGNST